jgi:5-methylcytosine-specific restriction protein A
MAIERNFRLLSSKQAVLDALTECDSLGRDQFLRKYGYKRSRKFEVIYNGRNYDSKAIVGAAFGKQYGSPLKYNEFSGGVATVVPVLEKLGFEIGSGSHPVEILKEEAIYTRIDLMNRFGGQLQSGIWTPAEFNAVFVFSGDSGKAFGYRDGWTKDGTFEYTGGGQIGDMTFTLGNKAIRDHRKDGKDLLLFEDLGKGKGVRYLGLFDCAGWEIVPGLDKNKNSRKIIVFEFVRVGSAALGDETKPVQITEGLTLDELREAAIAASSATGAKAKSGNARRTWYERSEKVKAYVLARAKGVCEACDKPAPFVKRDGTLYLEPHHITRLADDGPDHPSSVGAICPTCHREIHSGIDGDALNKKLQLRVKVKEKVLGQ